ncbi:MAG: bifunctional ADP-heptose synthase [Candidatus Micrarchaeota archaeon]
MDYFQLLDSFKKKRILVIGDLMLDEYFRGETSRQSPEASVPVVLAKTHDYHLGGAANVCANIAALGGKSALLGVVGGDEAGKILLGLARKKGIETDFILIDKSRPTTRKMRIYSNGSHMARLDEESTSQIAREFENELLEKFQKSLPKTDCVIISDYNKGVVSKPLAKKCIELANKNGIPILIDSKNYLSYDLSNATLLKPNLKELSKETSLPVETNQEIEKAGNILVSKLMPKALIVTAGEKGIFLFEAGKIARIDGIRTKVVDVSGAGDSVISVLALCIASKSSIHDAAIVANLAASIAISKHGTAAPLISEIESLIPLKHGKNKSA